MTINEILKEIMKDKGLGSAAIAKRLALSDRRVIQARISQKNISIDKLNEMLRVMDYEIVIQPAAKCDGKKYKVD